MLAPSTSVAETSFADLTDALASSAPTPGGGSAAALAAALGASLIAMVARLSRDRPRYEPHADLHAEAIAQADTARARFVRLAEEDAAAYATYHDARQLPHGTETETAAREQASAAAARDATDIPLATVQECHRLLELGERLIGRSNVSAASDLGVAALLLECAARGAAENALVNLPAVRDEAFAADVTAEVEQRLLQIQGIAARVHEQVSAGHVGSAST